MKKRSGCAALMSMILFAVCAARAEGSEETEMTLVVCNQAHLDAAQLETALQSTRRIFRNTPIHMTWLSTCRVAAKPTYLVVVITRRAPSSWTSYDAMGFAPIRTGAIRRAYVFYDRINEMVSACVPASFRVSGAGVLLGHAIAHELAHLLTGGDSHTPTGIMSGRWGYSQWRDAAMGSLLFTDDQIERMRRTLRSLQYDYPN